MARLAVVGFLPQLGLLPREKGFVSDRVGASPPGFSASMTSLGKSGCCVTFGGGLKRAFTRFFRDGLFG